METIIKNITTGENYSSYTKKDINDMVIDVLNGLRFHPNPMNKKMDYIEQIVINGDNIVYYNAINIDHIEDKDEFVHDKIDSLQFKARNILREINNRE